MKLRIKPKEQTSRLRSMAERRGNQHRNPERVKEWLGPRFNKRREP